MDHRKLIDELKRDEGVVLHAYKDSEGYLTIGVGRMIDAQLGGGITMDEAEQLLVGDILRCKQELDLNFPWWRDMSDARKRALINMCFNLGITRLKGFKKMLAALECGQWEKAYQEALHSKWARQVGARANRIAQMFVEG